MLTILEFYFVVTCVLFKKNVAYLYPIVHTAVWTIGKQYYWSLQRSHGVWWFLRVTTGFNIFGNFVQQVLILCPLFYIYYDQFAFATN